jgi:hypothetical protein
MKRTLIAALFFVALGASCWERYAERNNGRAYFTRTGDTYRVELTGWRFPLVHDPLSLILERTRRATLTLQLPRLEGVIEGSETLMLPDEIRYHGRVVISNRQMTIDLHYGDGSPLSWNDEYRLVQADGDESR